MLESYIRFYDLCVKAVQGEAENVLEFLFPIASLTDSLTQIMHLRVEQQRSRHDGVNEIHVRKDFESRVF